jgi:hypothetical protein
MAHSLQLRLWPPWQNAAHEVVVAVCYRRHIFFECAGSCALSRIRLLGLDPPNTMLMMMCIARGSFKAHAHRPRGCVVTITIRRISTLSTRKRLEHWEADVDISMSMSTRCRSATVLDVLLSSRVVLQASWATPEFGLSAPLTPVHSPIHPCYSHMFFLCKVPVSFVVEGCSVHPEILLKHRLRHGPGHVPLDLLPVLTTLPFDCHRNPTIIALLLRILQRALQDCPSSEFLLLCNLLVK